LQAGASPCYHLDTNYLLAYLEERAHRYDKVPYSDWDTAHTARQVVDWGEGRRLRLKASELAVGELVRVLYEKQRAEKAKSFLIHLSTLIEHRTVIIYSYRRTLEELANIVTEIRRGDNRIEINDILIVAQAMLDQECVGILTFDRLILGSKGLKRVLEEHDRKNFQISADPRKM